MSVRPAELSELGRVNELRRQVNELHVQGKPEVFRPGFSREMQDRILDMHENPAWEILVCERDQQIVGMAVVEHVIRPENPVRYEMNYLEVHEVCVDEACRRQGVGTELMEGIRAYARAEGLHRIDLDMWEFNQDALRFYEAEGFVTYRRYLEMHV